MNSLVIVFSYHHKNTEKIAKVIAKVLESDVKTPKEIHPEALHQYDLIGFGSGIYGSKLHISLLDLASRLPLVTNKKSFLFSTCGAPAFTVDEGQGKEYMIKSHSLLKEKLQGKGYVIVDEFMCAGWNTNSFLKFFGGINKGRPDAEDFKHAEEFALNLSKKSRI
jgi:flavodoxin